MIIQCYLPPDRGDIPAFTHNRSWYSIQQPRRDASLSRPRRCSKGVQPLPKTAYHNGTCDKYNHLWWDPNVGPLALQADALTTSHCQIDNTVRSWEIIAFVNASNWVNGTFAFIHYHCYHYICYHVSDAARKTGQNTVVTKQLWLFFVEHLSVNGRAGSSKHRTLEDLFRPPLDLLHKGSFKSVSLLYRYCDAIKFSYGYKHVVFGFCLNSLVFHIYSSLIWVFQSETVGCMEHVFIGQTCLSCFPVIGIIASWVLTYMFTQCSFLYHNVL